MSSWHSCKQVLEDKGRLVKRTQLKRSVYRVLGKKEGEDVGEVSHDSHLKSHDEEIYDEDDFYHQVNYIIMYLFLKVDCLLLVTSKSH